MNGARNLEPEERLKAAQLNVVTGVTIYELRLDAPLELKASWHMGYVQELFEKGQRAPRGP